MFLFSHPIENGTIEKAAGVNESDKRTSLAMNFLLEYGKGAGNGALPVPSPYLRNKCKKYDRI